MEDGEGGEDEFMQEEAVEGRTPLFRKGENQPSSQEVQEHMKAHIPHRSCCAHCVRGRGRNDPHRSGGGRRGPRDHSHFAIDYGFLKANNTDAPFDARISLVPLIVSAAYKNEVVVLICRLAKVPEYFREHRETTVRGPELRQVSTA